MSKNLQKYKDISAQKIWFVFEFQYNITFEIKTKAKSL